MDVSGGEEFLQHAKPCLRTQHTYSPFSCSTLTPPFTFQTTGTFLYVALNEVIPKELEHPDGHRLAKVAALLLGFGLMSLLAVWA